MYLSLSRALLLNLWWLHPINSQLLLLFDLQATIYTCKSFSLYSKITYYFFDARCPSPTTPSVIFDGEYKGQASCIFSLSLASSGQLCSNSLVKILKGVGYPLWNSRSLLRWPNFLINFLQDRRSMEHFDESCSHVFLIFQLGRTGKIIVNNFWIKLFPSSSINRDGCYHYSESQFGGNDHSAEIKALISYSWLWKMVESIIRKGETTNWIREQDLYAPGWNCYSTNMMYPLQWPFIHKIWRPWRTMSTNWHSYRLTS